MRTKEEITELITEIDNVSVKDKKDLAYHNNVRAAFRYVLKKLSTCQEVSKIEEEMRKHNPTAKLFGEGLDESEIKALTDFMNSEFEGYFKITGYGDLETVICNVTDAWEWVLEDLSTKQFRSDSYLRLTGEVEKDGIN